MKKTLTTITLAVISMIATLPANADSCTQLDNKYEQASYFYQTALGKSYYSEQMLIPTQQATYTVSAEQGIHIARERLAYLDSLRFHMGCAQSNMRAGTVSYNTQTNDTNEPTRIETIYRIQRELDDVQEFSSYGA